MIECYEADATCEGEITSASIIGWTWDDDSEPATPSRSRRTVTKVDLCLTHIVGFAATEGECERWLAGRDDWRQPVSPR